MASCIPKDIAAKLKESLEKGEIDANVIASMLPAEKAALRSILEDFVAEKLGVGVSTGEVTEITKKAKKIEEAQQKLGDDLGNPAKIQENVDFFKAKKEMEDYLLSKHPANRLKVLTGTIGRGMMLFSVKSPVLNIGSNIEVGFAEALSRRIAEGTVKGTDSQLAREYIKMVNKVYQETGYDVSRMTSFADTGTGGTRVLGETTHSQGPGAIRKTGQVIEDIVFKQMMGAPDVAFASAHFADSVNLNALKLAKGDTVKAKEMMTDAMRLEPRTVEGEILRQQAILDAQKATWTDKSWASQVSEGIRKIFNQVSGDLRLGDYLFPFVKTPANVIATGMDYAGMGVPKALVTTIKAVRSGELGSREHLRSISRDLVRSGLGLTAALAIASQIKDEDFVGAYDPARAQIESLRNSNTNAFRIGDKWISTDWLGPLAVTFSAIMYARKYGKTGGEKTFQYGKGVLSQIKELPGVSDVFDFIKTQAYQKNQSLEEMTGEARTYIIDQLSSRLIPSFVADLAKATDTKNRVATKGWEALKAKIPGVRQTLPVKRDIFGQETKTEPAFSTILFGSRVKTSQENAVVKELSDVSNNTGKGINFTNWDKSASKTLAQFKEKKGQTIFNQAKIKYGEELKKRLEITFKKPAYLKLTDDEKLLIINKMDAEVMDKILQQYHFKYKKEKAKSLPQL